MGKKMPDRELNKNEKDCLSYLNKYGVSCALIFITNTGLEKSILDATRQVRKLFKDAGFHDYDKQPQGQDSKIIVEGRFISHDIIQQTKISLYRPNTKDGDPRIWPTGLKNYASNNDVIAIFLISNQCVLVNLSKFKNLTNKSDANQSFLKQALENYGSLSNPAADELLTKLREIKNRGPFKAVCEGSTAVGRSLEKELGIMINSSQSPDFKGIEIKSYRAYLGNENQNRITLFACVPDWELSNLKSSNQILDAFGYQRENEFKLYCTCAIGKPNAQGLFLTLDEAKGWLRENSNRPDLAQVVIWPLPKLEQKLINKHKETFWVKAETKFIKNQEFFEIKEVIHTKGPNVFQFERLLLRKEITVDHLIKKTPSGAAKEKGPLFKIEKKSIPDLFLGRPVIHSF